MNGITGLGHVAIRVKEITRTLDFYERKLGFDKMFELQRDGKLWIVYLRITDDQYLEIFPDAIGDTVPAREALGLNHICLTVADLDAVAAKVEAAGIALTAQKKLGADGNRQAWIEDPDGNRIEFMEMAVDCLQAAAIKRLAAARRG